MAHGVAGVTSASLPSPVRVCPDDDRRWGMQTGGVRVLLVDDHAGFRAGARRVLEADGLEVVAEAGDARGACVEAARWLPDVVVLDVQLPDRSGFDIVEELTALGIAVVLISTRAIEDHADRLASCSASGFLGKDVLSGDAVRALVASQQ